MNNSRLFPPRVQVNTSEYRSGTYLSVEEGIALNLTVGGVGRSEQEGQTKRVCGELRCRRSRTVGNDFGDCSRGIRILPIGELL